MRSRLLISALAKLQPPGAHLVTKPRGSAMIRGLLGLGLSVSDGQGFATARLVRRIAPQSGGEAAALPTTLQP